MSGWAKRGAAALATAALMTMSGLPARADQGSAVLESKQPGEVLMNGKTYRISDSTVLESQEGNRISFAELPTKAEGASDDAAAVWYEASDAETAQQLHRLKLTGATPD